MTATRGKVGLYKLAQGLPYYRWFVDDEAEIAKPLYPTMKQIKEWEVANTGRALSYIEYKFFYSPRPYWNKVLLAYEFPDTLIAIFYRWKHIPPPETTQRLNERGY